MYTLQSFEPYIRIEKLVLGIDAVREKNFDFPGELHDFWEVILVCSGKAVATADERIYNLEPGNLLFHKPMQFHRIRSADNTQPHLQIVSFTASGRGMKYFEDKCLVLDGAFEERFSEITAAVTCAAGLYGKSAQDGRHSYYASLAASMLESFLLELSAKRDYKEFSLSHSEEQFARIVKVMKENCRRQLTLCELGELCGMSVSNMKRVFRCYSDIGLAKYFLTLKIRCAMQLLKSDMTSSQIARELGFNEISYFYSVFRRETGMTPEAFRKSHKS